MQESFKVQSTKNYGLFEKLKGNREINKANLNRIKESMQKELLPIPVLVNQNYEIIDGQHRVKAAAELELPVYYMVVPDMNLNDVHTLNSIGKKYSFDDYLEGYAAAKLEHYENALAFRKKYKFTAAVFMFIWTGSKSRCTSGVAMNKFKTGNLVINDLKKCYDIADNLTYLINEFKNELPLHKRPACIAMAEMMLHTDFNLDKLVKNLNGNAVKRLRYNSSVAEDWRRGLQKVYNFNVNKKNRITFWTFED